MRHRSLFRTLSAAVLCAGMWAASPWAAQSGPFLPQTYYNTFSHAHAPLARIRPGDAVSTRTLDASGRDEHGTQRASPPNPLTGPFYVEGAEPGDAIAIRFTRVRLNRDWGFSNYRLGLYSLLPDVIESLYPNRYKPGEIITERVSVVPWDIDLARHVVHLREPASGVLEMEFPVKPMLGCVGVAPAGDFAPTSSPAGSYGGNLDYNEIGEGTTVILPVYHPGALLFVGDGHALQGDGEPTGTGIETSMDVEFTVEVHKKATLTGPRAETGEYLISIGAQPEFVSSTNRALEMATTDMVEWLTTDYKLEPWAAHLLIGYQGKYDIVSVAGSVALKIPKSRLPPVPRAAQAAPLRDVDTHTHTFTLPVAAEVVATVTAACDRCDWREPGSEAALLELNIDGVYSQHVALTRGATPAPYRLLLGGLQAGPHRLDVRRDAARSARNTGAVTIVAVQLETLTRDAPGYEWVSQAPVLRARPGSVERFSDVPLLMYAESNVSGEGPGPYRYRYTVIFSNEDGGTPADRLMATWGRTTDIEFVLGMTAQRTSGSTDLIIQTAGHQWVSFSGTFLGTHPVLWVATDNNMVADRGPADAIWFAPAPILTDLAGRSREAVMDGEPWTYAVTAAEMFREGHVGVNPAPGSGKIPDPRHFVTIEACGDVVNAALAFDVGVNDAAGRMEWFSTDRGTTPFRIVRTGCFRAAAPVRSGVKPSEIIAIRARAYPREAPPNARQGSASVTLRAITRVLMLDDRFLPRPSELSWMGEVHVNVDGDPVEIPLRRAPVRR